MMAFCRTFPYLAPSSVSRTPSLSRSELDSAVRSRVAVWSCGAPPMGAPHMGMAPSNEGFASGSFRNRSCVMPQTAEEKNSH